MCDDSTEIEWQRDSVPVSLRFDDPYYSLDSGIDEARYVFLEGNDLPARFRDGFHIAELGFGTGLNLAVALESWRASGCPGQLRFTTFEAFPLTRDDALRALQPFGETGTLIAPVWEALEKGARTVDGPDFRFELISGDANTTLPAWEGRADAWFLDGFSPAKNPELWGAPLMAEVGRHTAPGGTAATYTAAGHVRRALEAAGFAVARQPGFGRKRHMVTARISA